MEFIRGIHFCILPCLHSEYNKLELRGEVALVTYLFKVLYGKMNNPAIPKEIPFCVPDGYRDRRRCQAPFMVPHTRSNFLHDAPMTRALTTLLKQCRTILIYLYICSQRRHKNFILVYMLPLENIIENKTFFILFFIVS